MKAKDLRKLLEGVSDNADFTVIDKEYGIRKSDLVVVCANESEATDGEISIILKGAGTIE